MDSTLKTNYTNKQTVNDYTLTNDATQIDDKILNIKDYFEGQGNYWVEDLQKQGMIKTTHVIPWRVEAILQKETKNQELFKKCYKLGQGSFGKVLKCFDAQREQYCAIKLINYDELTHIQAEIEINKKLSHFQSVVKVLWPAYLYQQSKKDIVNNQSKNINYLIIPFELGKLSLRTYLKNTKIEQESDLQIITKQLIQGVKDMHSHNIAHRDIKPDNIIYCDGVWKLADFGVSEKYTKVKDYHHFVGTLFYMSPNQIDNKQDIQNLLANDMYALGLTLYEIKNSDLPKMELKQNFNKTEDPFFKRFLEIEDYDQLCQILDEQNNIDDKFILKMEEQNINDFENKTEIAFAYAEFGQYERALEIFQNLVGIAEERFGRQDINTIQVLLEMSKVYYKLNQWNESLKICQELVQIENLKINRGELHLQLGLIQFKLGNLNEAEKNINQSEKLFQSSEKKMILRVQELKALVLRDKKEFNQSLVIFNQIKKEKELLYGEDNIYVYQTISNIASIHYNQKDYKKAEILQEQVCQSFSQYYGKKMLETINAYRSLIAIKIQMEKYLEAETLLKQEIEISNTISKVENIKNKEMLGKLYCITEVFDRAQEIYEEIIENKESLYGKDHIEMLSSLQHLAFVLEENKEYEKAKIIYEKIFGLLKKNQIRDVFENSKLLFHYSSILMHLNQLQMSRAIYMKGFQMIEVRLEQTKSLYLNYLQNLSIVNMKLHQLDEAVKYQDKVMKILQKKCPNHAKKDIFEFNKKELEQLIEENQKTLRLPKKHATSIRW